MIKFLISFLIITVLFGKGEVVLAEEKISENSATLFFSRKIEDKREKKLQNFLNSQNSPLAPYSFFFIKMADYYSLDWRLLPAIAGVESEFGKRIPPHSFNAYGWNNGNYYFKNWQDGIRTVAKGLKENYINKNARIVEEIGLIYAPPSPFWAKRVRYFMEKIESANPLLCTFSL